MSNFVITNNKKEATIKSERDLWRYACNLKIISIGESKAKIYNGVNITIDRANEIVDFANSASTEDIGIELDNQGFTEQEVNDMLMKSLMRKHRKHLPIKTLKIGARNLFEQRMTIDKIDLAMDVLKDKVKLKKPLNILITPEQLEDNSLGFFNRETNSIAVKTGDDLVLTFCHEVSHAYCNEITPKWASNESIFWALSMNVNPDLDDIEIFDDEAIAKANDKAVKERDKFVSSLNKRDLSKFNKKNYEKVEKLKSLTQDLHQDLIHHPIHISGAKDYYTAMDKKEWFARAFEYSIVDELEKRGEFMETGTLFLERKPVLKKYENKIINYEKLLKSCSNNPNGYSTEIFVHCFSQGITEEKEILEFKDNLPNEIKKLKKQYFSARDISPEDKKRWRECITPKINNILEHLLEERKGTLEKIGDKIKKVI